MFDLPATSSSPSSASPLTRRGLLAGGFSAAAALAVGRLIGADGVASADSKEFNAPGKALETADRLGEPPTVVEDAPPTVVDDVPPTVVDYVPPADGEILFPIVVGPEDNVYLFNNSFGACRSGCTRSHEGVDIMAQRGLPVRAVAAGELTKQYVATEGKTSGAGNGWTLFAADTEITWKFFHLDAHEEGLEEGDTVEAGQIIGYVGNTGTSGANSDTNYHLHFEYRPDNVAQNSFDLLQRDPNVLFYDL